MAHGEHDRAAGAGRVEQGHEVGGGDGFDGWCAGTRGSGSHERDCGRAEKVLVRVHLGSCLRVGRPEGQYGQRPVKHSEACHREAPRKTAILVFGAADFRR